MEYICDLFGILRIELSNESLGEGTFNLEDLDVELMREEGKQLFIIAIQYCG